MSEPLSEARIAEMEKSGVVWNIYEVLASHRALSQQLQALREERDALTQSLVASNHARLITVNATSDEADNLKQELERAKALLVLAAFGDKVWQDEPLKYEIAKFTDTLYRGPDLAQARKIVKGE